MICRQITNFSYQYEGGTTCLPTCALPMTDVLLIRQSPISSHLFRVIVANIWVRPKCDVIGREHGGVHCRALAVRLPGVLDNFHRHRQLRTHRWSVMGLPRIIETAMCIPHQIRGKVGYTASLQIAATYLSNS